MPPTWNQTFNTDVGGTGKQYTSTIQSPIYRAPGAQPEKIVNPWTAFQERRDQALAKLRAPPGTDEPEEACLTWGGAPTLSETPLGGGGFNTKDPTDEEEPDDRRPDNSILEWVEQEGKNKRKTSKIKVASEDDPETFVMVERIDEITFKSPGREPFNGRLHRFKLKHPSSEGG